jgi:hypothetical protein
MKDRFNNSLEPFTDQDYAFAQFLTYDNRTFFALDKVQNLRNSSYLIKGLQHLQNSKILGDFALFDTLGNIITFPDNLIESSLSLSQSYFTANVSEIAAGESSLVLKIHLMNFFNQEVVLPSFQTFQVKVERI